MFCPDVQVRVAFVCRVVVAVFALAGVWLGIGFCLVLSCFRLGFLLVLLSFSFGPASDPLWIRFVLGSPWDRLGIAFFWDRLWIGLGSAWGRHGIVLASHWDRVGIAYFWDRLWMHFRSHLVPICIALDSRLSCPRLGSASDCPWIHF